MLQQNTRNFLSQTVFFLLLIFYSNFVDVGSLSCLTFLNKLNQYNLSYTKNPYIGSTLKSIFSKANFIVIFRQP